MNQLRNLVALNEPLLASTAVSATRPTLAANGVSIAGWRINTRFSPRWACVFLDGSIAQTISSPTGGSYGPELWGYIRSQWYLLGYLNNGSDIPIAGSGQGYLQLAHVVGVCDRLAIAGTPSAGTCAVELIPVEDWS
jgi:hypothetical protein